MTATDPQALADATRQGRTAASTAQPISSCPFSQAQGSRTRVLAIAWRRGFREGELDQADSDGDLSRGTAASGR